MTRVSGRRPRGRRWALVALALSLGACRSSAPVFVCPVGEAGWDEWRLAVTVLEADASPGGVRLVGRVTDAETGDDLVGATVAVVGTGRGAAVQPDGRFVLEGLEVGQSLRFSFVGYAAFSLPVAELAGLEDGPRPRG